MGLIERIQINGNSRNAAFCGRYSGRKNYIC